MKKEDTLFRILRKQHLLTPRGLFRFAKALTVEGLSLMAILRFARTSYADTLALATTDETYTYAELYARTRTMADEIYFSRGIRPCMRVALLCDNSPELIVVLFALSSIGAHTYFLNPEMSRDQLAELFGKMQITHCLYEQEKAVLIPEHFGGKRIALSEVNGSLWQGERRKRRRFRGFRAPGELVVLTGGSSGSYKSAARKPSITDFLSPFFALLSNISIYKYSRVYIAPPIYHGFGLAAVIVTLLLGKTLFIRKGFSAIAANELIRQHRVEVLVAVPTMIRRMLKEENVLLPSLRCILSGGAPLDEKLVAATECRWGQVLFNLYGTSEAGFVILATPEMLHQYPLCCGKPIKGVWVEIEEPCITNGIGVLCVRSQWAMQRYKNRLQSTGDLASCNAEGIIFLHGRVDEMIVSGGENVYPEEVAHLLLSHPAVEQAAVRGIANEDFGQALEAFLVLSQPLEERDLQDWLRHHAARFQRPHKIHFVSELPIFATGKINSQALSVSPAPLKLDPLQR